MQRLVRRQKREIKMSFKTTLLIPLCGLAMAGAAFAQEGEPVDRASLSPKDRMAMDVTSYVAATYFTNLTEVEFDDAQVLLRLMMIAKQNALAVTCDGFELNSEQYTAVLNDVLAPFQELVDEGQNNLVTDRVMFGYGTLFGGELALASYDPAGYCAFGVELRQEFSENDDSARFLVLAPAE